MSKKKTASHQTHQGALKPAARRDTTKLTPAQRAREAKDARKFFIVLGIGTIFLVIFLYFIFVGKS